MALLTGQQYKRSDWEAVTVGHESGDSRETTLGRDSGFYVGRAKRRIAAMPAPALPRVRPKTLVAIVIMAAPAILFYAILFRQALNVPIYDDYEALLDFLNQMAGLSGAPAKVSYFLAAQHNEYKLFFEHGLVWLQFAATGHIDLRSLIALGDGFVLLLAILLWKMFLPNHKDFTSRLTFFIPVPWLLFQLQYVETLDWAMASLQNLPVLVFSLGAIYYLVRATRRAFCVAVVLLILAIASSGNGLVMIPVGALMLILSRRYIRVVSWLLASAVCVVAYAYHYNVLSSQSPMPVHPSVFSTVIRPQPFFVIAFIGNAACPPIKGPLLLEVFLCLLVGSLLCLLFIRIARRGYVRRNSLVSYCVLYLLLTAIGVAGLRSEFSIVQSLSSRYGIYSALFLIFSWFAIVEEFLQDETAPLRKNPIMLGTIAAALVFSLYMDVSGWRYLTERNDKLIQGMTAYEHNVSAKSVGPILPKVRQTARFDELDRTAPLILRESTRLGIYCPPAY